MQYAGMHSGILLSLSHCQALCITHFGTHRLSENHHLSVDVQISVVVYMFKYPIRTALAVGLSMAQIGEFAFVLLSVASQLGLLPYQVYMLLMGERHLLSPDCNAAPDVWRAI